MLEREAHAKNPAPATYGSWTSLRFLPSDTDTITMAATCTMPPNGEASPAALAPRASQQLAAFSRNYTRVLARGCSEPAALRWWARMCGMLRGR